MRKELVEQIKRHEGFRALPYRDLPGYWTIGYGHLLTKVTAMPYQEALRLAGGEWTRGHAEDVLSDDLFAVYFDLRTRVSWFHELNEARQDALINMAFNLGVNGLMKFKKMWAALRAGDFDKAAHEALDSLWAKQVGARAVELAKTIREGV